MNNKKGGVGGKILLVLILMLLAAAGGAYGYRVLDGKMAVRDASKLVKDVEVSDYDAEEATQVQAFINSATKDLETAATRKEVYEIIDEFKENVSKIQTKTEKELEAARREAEEARKANQNNSSNATDNSIATGGSDGSDGNDGSGYKSNNLTDSEEGDEDSDGGLFSNLFGG